MGLEEGWIVSGAIGIVTAYEAWPTTAIRSAHADCARREKDDVDFMGDLPCELQGSEGGVNGLQHHRRALAARVGSGGNAVAQACAGNCTVNGAWEGVTQILNKVLWRDLEITSAIWGRWSPVGESSAFPSGYSGGDQTADHDGIGRTHQCTWRGWYRFRAANGFNSALDFS